MINDILLPIKVRRIGFKNKTGNMCKINLEKKHVPTTPAKILFHPITTVQYVKI